MGFEPTTPTLARLCSTPELHPHPERGYGGLGRLFPMPNGGRLGNRKPARGRTRGGGRGVGHCKPLLFSFVVRPLPSRTALRSLQIIADLQIHGITVYRTFPISSLLRPPKGVNPA